MSFQCLRRLQTPETPSTSSAEHRRRIWDRISLKSSRAILLTGIGVYSPQGVNNGGSTVIHVDARPIESPLRKLDTATPLQSAADDVEAGTISVFAKRPFHLNGEEWWEVAVNIAYAGRGAPPFGVWSTVGRDGRDSLHLDSKAVLSFSEMTLANVERAKEEANFQWRECVKEGQIPYLLLWNLD